MSESLKEKTAKGIFWGALNSTSSQVLNLVIGIFLARLLTPQDYGIVGVLGIFVAIAGDLQSSGFSQGLINLPRPTARDYNSVFSFNVSLSVMMYAILFLAAPYIAQFFHEECLTSVSRVVFLSFLISSLGIAHNGYMVKNMMNKEIAIVGALSLIASGAVGITLAFLDFSYWSLAWQQVTYITVTNLGRYYYVKQWRPRLTMDFGPVREMVPFAMKILVTKIINTTSNNILTVIFGRLFPMHAVGNYSQAYKWDNMANSMVANTIGQIAQTVLVEAKGEAQQEGNHALAVYRKMLRFTSFMAMPLMFGLALVSREFILITIGSDWTDCIALLQVLCISGAFIPLYTMYQNLSISQGRSDVYMWLNIGQIIMQIAVILACYRYGIFVMVCAYSAFMILWLLPWHHYAGRLIGYRWTDMLKDTLPFTLAAAAVMAVTYFATTPLFGGDATQPAVLWALLALRCIIAAILYYIVMKVARVKMLEECERFIVSRIRK